MTTTMTSSTFSFSNLKDKENGAGKGVAQKMTALLLRFRGIVTSKQLQSV
jgi:hypothetical protein